MTIKFSQNDKGSPAGQACRCRTAFFRRAARRPQAHRLRGVGAPQRRPQRHISSAQYTVNGERRSFALLRVIVDSSCQDKLRDVVLDAYKEFEAELAAAV
jgi:hypothetical protein